MKSPIACLCLFSVMCYTAPKNPHQNSNAQTIKIKSDGQPVTINAEFLNNNNNQNEPTYDNKFKPSNKIKNSGGTSVAQNKSTATNINQNENTIKIRISQTMKNIMKISPRRIASSLSAWAGLNKEKIIASSIAGSYIALCATLIHDDLFIRSTTSWAAWKQHLSMEELHAQPQDRLGKELTRAIQQRHVNAQNPTDHVTPLVTFIKTVDWEMKILNRYLAISKTIRACRLLLLFPTNQRMISLAEERKQRLSFVKHVFISWEATDNLANFNH